MSDRIAVFSAGRIEQVGTASEVYEHPASEFVAGFVGTSNLLRGDASRSVLGLDGVFSVRPEKIRIVDPGSANGDGEHGADGTVSEVVYVGDATRFVVELDAGGSLVALQQNTHTSSSDVAGLRGSRVRLVWRREHEYRVA